MAKILASRREHYLKDNKTGVIPSLFIFFDVETSEKELDKTKRELILRLGEAVFIDLNRDLTAKREEWLSFDNQTKFWDFVEAHCYNKMKLRLIAHNIGFDFAIVKGYKELAERGWELKKWINESSIFIMNYRKGEKSMQLLDTMNIFKTSLEQLGDDFSLPKLQIDFKTANEEELRSYCHRDVEIIKEAYLKFIKFIVKNDLGNIKETISGQALSTYRHRFLRHKILIHNNLAVIDLERESYKGGRVECFYIGKYPDTCYLLDINSMYPAIMHAEQLPYQLVRYYEHATLRDLQNEMRRYGVITDAEIVINHPIIGVKRERLIFPIGKFRAVLTSPEIELLQNYGYIKEIHRLATYKMELIFEEYIDFMWSKRKEAQEKGNKSDDILLKYLMNSLSGKFGQKNTLWNIVKQEKNRGLEGREYFYDGASKKWKHILHFSDKVVEKEGEFEAYDSVVAIPSFVTAYGRCQLWKLIEEAGYLRNCLYCDTDSLIVNEEGKKRLERYINERELGGLKEEKSGLVEIRNVKDYTFEGVEKRKGIKKTAVRIDENVYEQDFFVKFKTALRLGDPNKVIVERIRKQMDTTYKKGEVSESGWIKPFIIKETPPH